ncbi:GatB/YqeY domain-containing protein [Brumimicrobium aurantiacum]|uniref:GatB/YqeY domain-containing protein n=1 Tax=Brumimicrobium aurantiacum TaxID=1737063 RepID=A0A3E1EY11_9FLAO|nr:GatB/YqeY domain-containing protein [Brumimicrobium aurantiacum]RFC54439.1 GatB/YqeY domain-containing protein [Brumimicrobium aurantiacum]
MSLTDIINQDIKDAMRAKDKEKLGALRDIKSKLLNEATSGNGEVDESKENKIIIKLHKQRMDSHAVYVDQGREDLAEAELFEAKIIENYMPKMMDEAEIRTLVVEAIEKSGASGPQDMGKVMGPLTKSLAGKADGKLISTIVKEELNK